MTIPAEPTRLNNIEALRALAACNVILVHLLEQSAKYSEPVQWLAFFGNWGDCGVDLFFVISGFIMVHIQRHRPSAPLTFLARRAYRVLPLYWALTLFYAGLWLAQPQLFGLAEIDASRLWHSLAFASLYDRDTHPILYLGWTLEYEMAFYAVFGLCIWLAPLAGAVWIATVALTMFWALTPMDAVVFEFIFGAVLALVHKHRMIRNNALTLLVAGTLWLGFTISEPAHAFDHRWLYWGIPSTMIVAGAVNLPQIPVGALTFLGNASYSIYLIQVFTISAYYKAVTSAGFDIQNDVDALVCGVLTVAAGIVCYLCFERRLSGARRHFAWPRPRRRRQTSENYHG